MVRVHNDRSDLLKNKAGGQVSAQLSLLPPPRLHDGVPLREERAKDRGMRIAASAHWRDLQMARQVAREVYLSNLGKPISADDVRAGMLRRFPDTVFGNWMGSVFRGKEWEPAGWVKSKTPGSHANRLVSWKLTEEGRE